MPTQLSISDTRMLQLMEYCVNNSLVATEAEFWEQIGFARTNISNVRAGKQGFTKDHIRNACTTTGANANWFFGIEKNMFREKKGKGSLQLLKEAVAAAEVEFGMKKVK